MSIFFIFIPATLLANLADWLIDRPRRPCRVKVYRKHRCRTFGWAPARIRL